MTTSFLCLLILCIYSCACNNVIVSKNLGGEAHATLGADLLVTIQIFNLEKFPIYDVSLADTWPEDFQPVHGLQKATWEEIPAGATVTHSYIIKPLKSGVTDFQRADVSYRYVS